MASVVEATGKTVADALNAALQQLGCQEADVDYEVLEAPTKGFLGFFSKDAKVRVTKKEVAAAPAPVKEQAKAPVAEPAPQAEAKAEEAYPSVDEQLARAEKFLRDVFDAMNIAVTWQKRDSEDGVVFNLEGDNLGILIGKHGQTLDSLQYLVNLTANRGVAEGRVRIIIDIEGYRSRREETLMRLAGHLAEKACRIGDEVHLEPMNRHERKIIHMALQDNRRVSTYSAGDEPRRYVVIVPRRRRSRRREHEKEYNED